MKANKKSKTNKEPGQKEVGQKESRPTKKGNIKGFLILHFAVFILSLASLCSKKASSFDFLSLGFIVMYGGVIVALFVYALIWQQALKRMPLVIAFANKVATLFWSFLYGVLIFHEEIRLNSIIGILVVAVGVLLVVGDVSKKETSRIEAEESEDE